MIKQRKLNQSYVLVDIAVDYFDDQLISGLMKKHTHLAAAWVDISKFGKNDSKSLKFYINHLNDNKDEIISDIKDAFKNHDILIKVKQ